MLSSFYTHTVLVVSCIVFGFSLLTLILRLEIHFNLFQVRQTVLFYGSYQTQTKLNLPKNISVTQTNETYFRKQILTSNKNTSIFNRFTYINPPKSVCGHLNDTKNSMIIIVLSAPLNFDYRQAIRATWGRNGRYNSSHIYIQTIFFVGTDDSVQSGIRNEQEMFNDVIEIGIPDKYPFLSYKELASLLWTRLYCPLARILFRIDDTILLDVFLLLNRIKYRIDLDFKDGLYGWFRFNNTVLRQGKWAVTKNEYQPAVYPPYTLTMGYLFSNGTCQRLIEAVNQPNHHIVRINDVYITGILRELAKIPFYTYSNLEHVVTYHNQMLCEEHFQRRPSLLVCTSKGHMSMQGDPYEYYDIWDIILAKHNKSLLTI